MSETLTSDEMRLLAMLGEAADLFARVVGDGRPREQDIAEFFAHIHDCQHAVMAQAAARAYPDQYRLLGDLRLLPPGQP